MNILLLNWRDPKHAKAGGAEKLNVHIIKPLIERGDTVTWYGLSQKGLPSEEYYQGIRIIRFGNYLSHFIAWPFFLYSGKFGKIDFIIDCIHGIGYFSNLFASSIKKRILICEVAKNIWDEMVPFPGNIIGKVIEPIIFMFYSRCEFWTISHSTKKDLIKMGIRANAIKIVTMGFDSPDRVPKLMKYKSPTALFVGRLAKMKGIKDAIEAIRLVNNELETKWTLLIVGKGTDAYEHELKRMATKMLGNKHIKFLGYLTEEEKFEEMEKSWVLVVPSSREGWGMIVGEANHVGTQVIGYNSPGLTDSLSYYSSDNIIVNRNPKSLAKAIKLLKQPDKIHGKIKPGWEILEKEILTDIYEEK